MKPNVLLSKINDKEFQLFRDVIYKESGINLTDRKKALMQFRLLKRLRVLNIDTFQNYYNYLNSNYNNEIINLINCITTNKTDFFREPKHFEFIKNTILPKFESEGMKKMRIWSAGCSTGEEPYSIPITIAEYYKDKSMPDVKIFATDIDTNVLQIGAIGRYKEGDLEGKDNFILKKYFLKGRGENRGFLRAKDSIKKMIFFRRLNLFDEIFPMRGLFDLIFCRNVIIYFNNEMRTELAFKFYNFLAWHGYFFAGHSETLVNFSDMYNLIGNTVYKKERLCMKEKV